MENGRLKEKMVYSLELEFKGEGKGLGVFHLYLQKGKTYKKEFEELNYKYY